MPSKKKNETVIVYHSGIGTLDSIVGPLVSNTRDYYCVSSLYQLESLITPSEHASIVVLDWNSWEDPEDFLNKFRSRHYVIPIIVVGSNISHSDTLDLLRQQVNDVLINPTQDHITQSLDRIFLDFPVVSLSNIYMYSTRRYKALSHMNDSMDKLLEAMSELKHRHKEPAFQIALKNLPPQAMELPKQVILIVDDLPTITQSFSKKFQQQYAVLTANSATEALDIARVRKNIELIILDIEMPGRKGNEIIGELRALIPKVGIVIQTAFRAHDIAVESFQNGVLDYINKSSNPRVVAEVIHSALMMKRQWDADHLLPLRLRQELFVQYAKIAAEGGYPIYWEDLHEFFPDVQLGDVILSEPLTPEWFIEHPLGSMK